MPEIERDGEELPWLSPGVGCDSTAQVDKVKLYSIFHIEYKAIEECVTNKKNQQLHA